MVEVHPRPKRTLITGAARGIGKALAAEFGRAGHEVVGVDRDRETTERTSRELGIAGVRFSWELADLARSDELRALEERLLAGANLDVLIHNAGINHTSRFAESDLPGQERVIRINLLAPLVLTGRLLAGGKLNRGGSIVFISSLSRFVSYPGAAVYAATKDGLASYARSLAVELASHDIHVLTVYPGATRTAHARLHSPDNSREERRMAPEVLARRVRRAVEKRRRVLVPGFGNKVFAALGSVAPGFTEWAMKKTILLRLPERDGGPASGTRTT